MFPGILYLFFLYMLLGKSSTLPLERQVASDTYTCTQERSSSYPKEVEESDLRTAVFELHLHYSKWTPKRKLCSLFSSPEAKRLWVEHYHGNQVCTIMNRSGVYLPLESQWQEDTGLPSNQTVHLANSKESASHFPHREDEIKT